MSSDIFNTRQIIKSVCSSLVLVGMLWSSAARVNEGGGPGIYPDGIETHFTAAMPPPGFYTLLYGGLVNYDEVIGNSGNALPIKDFKVEAESLSPRFVWVTNQQVLGGQLAIGAVLPLVDVTFQANGKKFQDTGLGDITLDTGLGYHLSDRLHVLFATALFLPNGEYSKTDPASIGHNYYCVQPIFAVSYLPPTGATADIKMMYDFNMQNRATSTTSGQAFHADFDAGWAFGNGYEFGAGGHIFEQITSDSGANSAAGKSRAIGLGPSGRYFNGKNFLIALTLTKEFAVRNRPEGTQAFFKIGIPFD